MEINDIPHNMDFIFGPNLREVPVSKIEMMHGMIYIKEQLQHNRFHEEEKAKWNGLLGVYLRIVGELEDSEKHLQHAIQMYENLKHERGAYINKLRLAHTYQWWTDYETSNAMFTNLQDEAESNMDYADLLDFVYQHCGKNHFDQGNYYHAISYFEKALSLREEKDNPDLISSTENAIKACQYRLEHNI